MTTGLDRTYHAHRFIFSFTFYFFVCSVWWTKLATRQLFTARYIHTIVSYRIKRVKKTRSTCRRYGSTLLKQFVYNEVMKFGLNQMVPLACILNNALHFSAMMTSSR